LHCGIWQSQCNRLAPIALRDLAEPVQSAGADCIAGFGRAKSRGVAEGPSWRQN